MKPLRWSWLYFCSVFIVPSILTGISTVFNHGCRHSLLEYLSLFSLFSYFKNALLTATLPLGPFLKRLQWPIDEPNGVWDSSPKPCVSFSHFFRHSFKMLSMYSTYFFRLAAFFFVLHFSSSSNLSGTY